MIQRQARTTDLVASCVKALFCFSINTMTRLAIVLEKCRAIFDLPAGESLRRLLQAGWFKQGNNAHDYHHQHEGDGAYDDFDLHIYSSS